MKQFAIVLALVTFTTVSHANGDDPDVGDWVLIVKASSGISFFYDQASVAYVGPTKSIVSWRVKYSGFTNNGHTLEQSRNQLIDCERMFSASREASAAKDVATHQWVPLPQIDDENAPYKPIGEASVDEVVAKKLCKQPPDPVKIKSARDKWEASAHFTGKAVFAFGASYITCHYTYNGKEFSRQFPDRGGPSSNSCPAMIDPPQQGEQTTVPAASSSTGALADAHVRPDPQHPLRIGEDWYPQASIRLKEEGRCVVTITVAADGHIASESLQTSSGFPRLDEACLKAFHGQRMLPAIENGKPVETTVAIPIDWHRPQ